MTARSITVDELDNKPKDGVRILNISDVHLGNRKNTAVNIVWSLDRNVTNSLVFKTLDALTISGDLLDRLLTLPTEEVLIIDQWMVRTLKLAKRYSVAIRVLEGTPSHDWKQPKRMCDLNIEHNIDCDIMYYDDITVVDDKSLGLTIGYIPDEIRETCEQTTTEFRELLATRALNKVDLIIMHGMFKFQVPKAAAKSISHFIESDWLPLVKYHIVIGHDHRFKQYDAITVPSSWDRLSHNEEEDKGAVIIDIANGVCNVRRLINKDAMPMVTVDAIGINEIENGWESFYQKVETTLADISNRFNGYYGYLRFVHDDSVDLSGYIADIQRRCYGIVIETKKQSQVKETLDEVSDDFDDEIVSVTINVSNISDILLREMDMVDDAMMSAEIEDITSSL